MTGQVGETTCIHALLFLESVRLHNTLGPHMLEVWPGTEVRAEDHELKEQPPRHPHQEKKPLCAKDKRTGSLNSLAEQSPAPCLLPLPALLDHDTNKKQTFIVESQENTGLFVTAASQP